jgi:hypothetical protein
MLATNLNINHRGRVMREDLGIMRETRQLVGLSTGQRSRNEDVRLSVFSKGKETNNNSALPRECGRRPQKQYHKGAIQ